MFFYEGHLNDWKKGRAFLKPDFVELTLRYHSQDKYGRMMNGKLIQLVISESMGGRGNTLICKTSTWTNVKHSLRSLNNTQTSQGEEILQLRGYKIIDQWSFPISANVTSFVSLSWWPFRTWGCKSVPKFVKINKQKTHKLNLYQLQCWK